MKKIKVAATGLDGLVGSRIQELLREDFDFINLTVATMDITNIHQVKSTLYNLDFDIFLHLAAFTDVDRAEINKDLAWKINVEGTKNVFEIVSAKKKKFIYISTDFVFDGRFPPFDENSKVNPLGFYGLTKLEGEKIVGGEGMIVRISYPYRAEFSPKKDIVRNIVSALSNGKKIMGVVDNKITLTFIDDISHALKYLFRNFRKEIFHIVGGDCLSGFEAILQICEVFGLDKSLVSETTFENFYKGKATRPKNGNIISKKNNFHRMRELKEGLYKIKKQLT